METVQLVEEGLVAKTLEAESHKAWSPMEEGRSPFSPLSSNFLQISPKFLQPLRLLALWGLQGAGHKDWGQELVGGQRAQRQEPGD